MKKNFTLILIVVIIAALFLLMLTNPHFLAAGKALSQIFLVIATMGLGIWGRINRIRDRENEDVSISPPLFKNTATDYGTKSKKNRLSVALAGLNDEDFEQPYGENSYIQNNSDIIESTINVYNPKFSADAFCDWSKRVVMSLIDKGIAAADKISASDFDGRDIGEVEADAKIYMCYLHRYKVYNNFEYMTVYMSIYGGGKEVDNFEVLKSLPKYFITFKRPSQYMYMTKGEPVLVSCPHCGGDIHIAGGHAENCPYCGHAVTLDEYDWLLCKFELIKNDTMINNSGVSIKA